MTFNERLTGLIGIGIGIGVGIATQTHNLADALFPLAGVCLGTALGIWSGKREVARRRQKRAR
jgi:hypothetical protein